MITALGLELRRRRVAGQSVEKLSSEPGIPVERRARVLEAVGSGVKVVGITPPGSDA